MERGPLALFGAIVAVGLGPAMWLGAQFGTITLSPRTPPAATSEQNPNHSRDAGKGGGAGSAPDPSVVLESKPRANYKPLRPTPSASPSASATDTPDPGNPTSAATTTPTPSDEPSSPPTETTTEPTDPPTGSTGGPAPPPSPPPTGSDQAAHAPAV